MSDSSLPQGFAPVIEPELKKLLPRQTDDEIALLEQSIRNQGILQPLTVWRRDGEYVLVDGFTRFEIAKKLHIDIPSTLITIIDLKDMDGAKRWMLKHQLGRRNLTDSQRAMIGARLADLEHGANQHVPRGTSSQAEAAKTVGVSRQSVNRGKKVLKKGAPELVEAVDCGAVDVKSASKVADLPKEEQRAIVAQGPKAVKEAAKIAKLEEKVTESGIPYRAVDRTKKPRPLSKRSVHGPLVAGPPEKLTDILAECVTEMEYVTKQIAWALKNRMQKKFPGAFKKFSAQARRLEGALEKLGKALAETSKR